MARTNTSILNKSRGRFLSLTVGNTKLADTTVSAKIVNTSPRYVTIKIYDPVYRGESETYKLHRNSIKSVN